MPDIPTEEAVQIQSFKTMVAMGRMANAITDHLTADKQTAEPNSGPTFETIPGPMVPLDSDLQEIRESLDKHRKALAIISTFAQFTDVGFFVGTKPDEKVKSLIKLKACDCVGTGWVARDETCKQCKQQGYIEA